METCKDFIAVFYNSQVVIMGYFVSIIVPVYKVEAFIERCVRSLFEQSLLDVEYIFVDDCGGDRSIEIIKELLGAYPHRKYHVRFLQNECNSGSAESRNNGLTIAKGDYIAFCDGDDWMEKSALEKMYLFAIDGGHDLIWTDFYYNFANNEVLSKEFVKADAHVCIRALLCEQMHGALWNKLYKRSLFQKFNISFIAGADVWEDLCLNIQMFYLSNNLGYLPESFYHYEQSGNESITRCVNSRKLNDMKTNADAITNFLQAKTGEKFTHELLILKLAAKQTLLFGSDMAGFKQWKITYPESNSYILQFLALPIHFRILGWCSAKGIWSLIRIWLIIKRFKYKREKEIKMVKI